MKHALAKIGEDPKTLLAVVRDINIDASNIGTMLAKNTEIETESLHNFDDLNFGTNKLDNLKLSDTFQLAAIDGSNLPQPHAPQLDLLVGNDLA